MLTLFGENENEKFNRFWLNALFQVCNRFWLNALFQAIGRNMCEGKKNKL